MTTTSIPKNTQQSSAEEQEELHDIQKVIKKCVSPPKQPKKKK
jgi:hypothetical protein